MKKRLLVFTLLAVLCFFTGCTKNNQTANTNKIPTPSIAGYQVYTNDTYNYSFEFPATWSAIKTEYENNLMELKLSDENNKELVTIRNPHLGTGFETFDTESTKEIATNYPNTEITSMILIPKPEEIISNNLGVAYWQLGCNSQNRITCQQETNDSGIITMAISKDEETKQKDIQTFYNILNSIKFLE